MHSTGERWTLGHRPALDGVRGIAILLVLGCHTLTWPLDVYGGAGVDLFFALSGFLITSLLLDEHHKAQAVSLRGFYLRRARRLLPALLVYVLVVTIARILTWGDTSSAFVAAAVVLGYVANWAMVAGFNTGYFGQTWSLAVEEQFYLVWPFAVLALLRRSSRGVRIGVCLGAVALICLWRGVVYHGAGQVLDEGSVSRAAPLLIGCAAAFYLDGRPEGVARPRTAALLVALLLVAPWLPHPAAVEHLDTGLLAAGIILCCARGGGARWLEWSPLGLLGRRSYGLYLWHYPPMIAVLSLPLTGWVRAAACVATLAVAWLLTLLSWRFVEQPFLRQKGRLQVASRPEPSRALSASWRRVDALPRREAEPVVARV